MMLTKNQMKFKLDCSIARLLDCSIARLLDCVGELCSNRNTDVIYRKKHSYDTLCGKTVLLCFNQGERK